MAKYHLTNLAVKDLANIWNYTFDQWSEEQADGYYAEFIRAFERIADNPGCGKKYNLVDKDLLGLRVNRHIVFYITIGLKNVEITRILHERMDLKSRLK